MGNDDYKARWLILVAVISSHFSPTWETSQDKRSRNGLSHNGIQDENFHELHRWKPPVRLIPFDPSRIHRVPSKRADASELDDAGSGKISQLPCDDEDGDCGEVSERDGISSGDGLEVKTVTGSPENKPESQTELNAIVFTVSKPKHPLTPQMIDGATDTTNSGVLSTSRVTSLNAKGTSEGTSKSLEFKRIETIVGAKTNSLDYGRIKMKTLPVTLAAAVKFRAISSSKKVARTTPNATSLLYLDRESTGTTTRPENIAAKRAYTATGTQKRGKSAKIKNNALSISPLISTPMTVIDIGIGTKGRNELEGRLDEGLTKGAKTFTKHATRYLTRSFLPSNDKQGKDSNARSLNSSFIKIGSEGTIGNETNKINLTGAKDLLHVDHNIMLKRIESIQQALKSNNSHLLYGIRNSSNHSFTQKQLIQMSNSVQMKGKVYTNLSMSQKISETKMNRSVTVLDGVALENSLHTQSRSFQSINAYIYANRVENFVSNMCLGVICKAGGVCKDYGANRGRCLCPIGTGGKYCDKERQFTHPRFHGSSYMFFNNSKRVGRNFRISIEFKADATDGIIFFGGDPRNTTANFFALMLIDGYIQLRTNCRSGFLAVTGSKKVSQSIWHRVTARKFRGKIYLQVDNELLVYGDSKCLARGIHLNRLYLGGLQHDMPQMRNIGLIPGFTGCVRKFSINHRDYYLGSKANREIIGIDIADCTAGSCDTKKCLNRGECMPVTNTSSRCSCRLGFTNPDCSKGFNVSVPKFNSTGYIQFESLGSSAWSKIEIEIVFRPGTQHGVLFYNGDRNDGDGDYILISLKNGFVELRFDCGTGEAVIRSRKKVSLQSWHHIIVNRKGNVGYLSLDSDEPVVGKSKGAFKMLKLRQPLFVGGIDYLSNIPISADVHSGFKGCIEKVIINKRKLLWRNAVGGHDVSGCDSHNCSKNTCSNNGVCESHKGEVWCHCYLGYRGKTCANGTRISTPRFSGHSFLKFEERELYRHLMLPTSALSLEFKSNHTDGLILWNGQKDTNLRWKGDFLSLALINGFLECRYNLGSGDVVLKSTKKLDDNKWHHVSLNRHRGKSRMQVDGDEIRGNEIISSYTMLNTDGELFLGGAENIVSTTGSRHLHGLTGCITNFQLGNRHIHLIDNASSGHHVKQCF